jgi:hypothetical protein
MPTLQLDGATKMNFRNLISLAMAVALLTGALTFNPGIAAAQSTKDWNDPVDTLEGGIGLHYGILGGHGLSFRLPISWYLYFQAAGGILHTGDHKQHNVGFQLHYLLRQDQRLRIYVGGGAGYFYDSQENQAEAWETDKNWNYGAGVGLEYLLGKRVGIQFDGDFAKHGDSGDITVIAQAGIHYYW